MMIIPGDRRTAAVFVSFFQSSASHRPDDRHKEKLLTERAGIEFLPIRDSLDAQSFSTLGCSMNKFIAVVDKRTLL